MTTKKQQTEQNRFLILGIGILIFLPLIIFSFLSYTKLKNEFLTQPNVRRVVDIKNLYMPLVFCGALVVTSFILFSWISNFSNILGWVFILFPLYLGVRLAKWLAVIYLGAVIDEENDYILFPHDMESYGVEDYITLKFLKECSEVDKLQISSIQKISRQAGKHLYIHGNFNSRRVSFSSKQKRDECIAALQSAKEGLFLQNELE